MQVYKLTNIFQLTTIPLDEAVASAHTGGWTESWWTNADVDAFYTKWSALQRARATMLPASAKIIGYRYTKYETIGNFLQPRGTEAGRQSYPGQVGKLTDLPQVSLHLLAQSGPPNRANVTLRGMPDEFMSGGEYGPTPAFKALLTAFITKATEGTFGFIGRDLSQASTRVLGITNDAITVNSIPAGLAIDDFVRMNRVVGNNGIPITGTFRVISFSLTAKSITVIGLPLNSTLTRPSGSLRRDLISFQSYTSMNVVRAVVKKVGSPLEKYRGRRSKRRVPA